MTSHQITKEWAYYLDFEADATFQNLKLTMTATSISTLPDYTLPFTVERDANDVGLWVIFMQQGQHISFLIKTLYPRHQAYSTYEKELLALVMATIKWHHNLQDHHFLVKTEHQSLKHLLEQRLSTML